MHLTEDPYFEFHILNILYPAVWPRKANLIEFGLQTWLQHYVFQGVFSTSQ